MTKTIELIFDFVSPNAYLVWQRCASLLGGKALRSKLPPHFSAGCIS